MEEYLHFVEVWLVYIMSRYKLSNGRYQQASGTRLMLIKPIPCTSVQMHCLFKCIVCSSVSAALFVSMSISSYVIQWRA